MKNRNLIMVILGSGLLGVSHFALASSWETGPCPVNHVNPGPAPCIDAEVNGTWYHFNGDGSHASTWHGLPPANTANLVFSGPSTLNCLGLSLDCTLTLGGKVKKCQDSNGDWRVGVQVNTFQVTGPIFSLCPAVSLGGFPWHAVESSNHTDFTDDCDNFIPYPGPNPSSLSGNLGEIDITIGGIPYVSDTHVHDVVFTNGTPSSFSFNSFFFANGDAGGPLDCEVIGQVSPSNFTNIHIH